MNITSLATAAFDTARASFKAMAAAAVNADAGTGSGSRPAGTDLARSTGTQHTARTAGTPPALSGQADAAQAEAPQAGRDPRRGTVLDAYA